MYACNQQEETLLSAEREEIAINEHFSGSGIPNPPTDTVSITQEMIDYLKAKGYIFVIGTDSSTMSDFVEIQTPLNNIEGGPSPCGFICDGHWTGGGSDCGPEEGSVCTMRLMDNSAKGFCYGDCHLCGTCHRSDDAKSISAFAW